ncbi:uncharacterized protein BYT42DRAFT_550448 [Radiomyces spectabilis]|uniref:uncharacterized protein n=1 Tax=Radiomyces spectabilis TaxID=64574 RepID=UPI002220D0FA|nr:uncharacterized protein BYT42DRAFT_550448 [Radiomyces spectabilis]KAI8364139.1 hypothetical protein BYT42DRAFT_550448 [Radiomyces spectabilis]
MTIAQWLAVDKEATKEVQAGLRFIHGRKSRAKPSNPVRTNQVDKGKAPERALQVNYQGIITEGRDEDSVFADTEERWSTEDEFSEIDSEDDHYSGYESDDTIFDYPYDPERLQKATPLIVRASIKGQEKDFVVDTGAACSLISKGLAQRLNLPINSTKFSVELITGTYSALNRVCKNVSIQVGGKLRPEHFLVLERDDDLIILGMTWFEGIIIKRGLIFLIYI